MRVSRRIPIIVLLAMLFVSVAAPAVAAERPARKIVVFESGQVNRAALARIERLGAVKLKELPLIGGAVVILPSKAAEKAAQRVPGVKRIDDDMIVTATARPLPVQPTPQVRPWGITKVGAPTAWNVTAGDGVKLAIIDTGIDLTHPDLAGNIAESTNTIRPGKSAADDNGHGTHVAGIAASVDNTIGVVGAAHDVDIYAVKALASSGRGRLSDIIEGLQWAEDKDVDVVNMSLGASGYNQSFADAIKAAYDSGIVLVAAAGNEGAGDDTVDYPAKFSQVIAVSATTSSNGLASFSSTGPTVELAAPGAGIYSTYRGWRYATLSGTSMASPHVAAAAALVIDTAPGAYDLDGDGWDPAEVRAKLQDTAQDLGEPGQDDSFGYGLVRADLAVQ